MASGGRLDEINDPLFSYFVVALNFIWGVRKNNDLEGKSPTKLVY